MSIHIVTCGTGILYPNVSNELEGFLGREAVRKLSEKGKLQKYLELKGVDTPVKLSEEVIFKLSPEMNGMREYLRLRKVGKVILLHTQTDDALACKEWVEVWLREKFNVNVEPHPIPITDLRSPENLVEGLRSLIETLYRILIRGDVKKAIERGEAYLNVTAGLKSITQIALVFSYLHGVTPYYIFEKTEKPFIVPCVPITYDVKKEYKDTLEKFRLKGLLSLDELGVTKSFIEELTERGLIEEVKGKYKITEIGRVFYEVLEKKITTFNSHY